MAFLSLVCDISIRHFLDMSKTQVGILSLLGTLGLPITESDLTNT